tara:strand:- start:299 stop:799 length:501 start_codon:yes stop_codon:yes gene_type:complete
MNRNYFLKTAANGGLVMAALPFLSFQKQEEAQLDKNVVMEFVRVSHGQKDKVVPMLEEYPSLLNAAHDWKLGDFETGLGAASHVGDKELALYFLDKGAQANIFTACLFGKMEIVRPMLTAFPNTLHAKGPHGFTLLHHAEKGGEEALEVKEYLVSLGAKETIVSIY